MEQNVIYQGQRFGCGITSIKMSLAFHLRSRKYLCLPEPDCSRQGMNLNALISYGEKYGLKMEAFRGDFALATPGDILLLTLDNRLHCVLLRKQKKGQYSLLDPSFGLRIIESGTLKEIYAGVLIKTRPQRQGILVFEKQKEKKKSHHIELIIASLAPNILMMSGILTLSLWPEIPALGITLFLLSLLSTLFSRQCTFLLMKRMDKAFIDGREKDSRPFSSLLASYGEYRSLSLVTLPTLFISLSSFLYIVVFLSLLNLTLGLMILGSGAILFGFFLAEHKNRIHLESDIDIYERLLRSDKLDKQDEKHHFLLLSSLTNSYAKSFVGEEIISLCLCFLTLLVTYIFSINITVMDLVCYGLSTYYCLSLVQKILLYPTQRRRYKRAEVDFYERK